MGNIETYLKWRGDLRFTERPFCEVDNLVFSEIVYYDLAGIVPTAEEGGSISMADAAQKLLGLERKTMATGGPGDNMLKLLAHCQRFGHVRLSRFVQIIDRGREIEFAAVTFSLEDGSDYIAFRGTGDLLVGWREDFSMSFSRVPAQDQAAAYLQQTLAETGRPAYVGGHSKGGNLALFAAMECPGPLQPQITTVYSNDGPGICNELLDEEKYRQVEKKLVQYVPAFCIFGNLFQRGRPGKIVASSEKGMMQHEAMSWQVEGDRFCEQPCFLPECQTLNQIFDTWIESATMEQRKAFVNDFFDTLERRGMTCFSDLTRLDAGEIESLVVSLTLGTQKDTKTVAGKLLISALLVLRQVDISVFFRTKEALWGIGGMLLGIFFMLSPDISARAVGLTLGGVCVINLCRHILRSAMEPKEDATLKKGKLILQLTALCILTFLTAVLNLVLHVTNLIVGIFFLVLAFANLRHSFSQAYTRKRRVAAVVLFVLLFMMGIVPIVSPGLLMKQYAFAAGTVFVIYGASCLVYALYREGKMQQKKL